jgi:hypothetical protein
MLFRKKKGGGWDGQPVYANGPFTFNELLQGVIMSMYHSLYLYLRMERGQIAYLQF